MLGGVNNTVLDIFGHNMNVCSGNQGVDSTLRLVTAYCNNYQQSQIYKYCILHLLLFHTRS